MNNTSPQPLPDRPCAPDGRAAAYEAPAVVYESELEVRAGTPYSLTDPLDLLGTD